ncbi:pilus assembly protein PilB [Solibacillus sp. R5-41]|uniref:pilus assembly protein PilB n=1 Tax=Solibacillus sp. R5-41 TaxID=2048654 RepID=UPI000C128F6C|nr:pilus assembly protein PilB [Solibacillus sp. R5-41]ATP39975.1 pilus assembly protein PilB [Solibacillus sp. R5-41]
MEKNLQVRIVLFPVIVTLITMFSICFVEGHWELEGIETGINLALLVLIFFAIYFFTITLVVPINIYFSNKIRNKLVSFIVFNIVGLILVVSIDIWFLSVFEFKSLYLTFPLFSIFSLVLKSEKNN